MDFEGTSNSDCIICTFSRHFNDGGGDYEEMVWHCNKMNANISFINDNNKPCGLPPGKTYNSISFITSSK